MSDPRLSSSPVRPGQADRRGGAGGAEKRSPRELAAALAALAAQTEDPAPRRRRRIPARSQDVEPRVVQRLVTLQSEPARAPAAEPAPPPAAAEPEVAPAPTPPASQPEAAPTPAPPASQPEAAPTPAPPASQPEAAPTPAPPASQPEAAPSTGAARRPARGCVHTGAARGGTRADRPHRTGGPGAAPPPATPTARSRHRRAGLGRWSDRRRSPGSGRRPPARLGRSRPGPGTGPHAAPQKTSCPAGTREEPHRGKAATCRGHAQRHAAPRVGQALIVVAGCPCGARAADRRDRRPRQRLEEQGIDGAEGAACPGVAVVHADGAHVQCGAGDDAGDPAPTAPGAGTQAPPAPAKAPRGSPSAVAGQPTPTAIADAFAEAGNAFCEVDVFEGRGEVHRLDHIGDAIGHVRRDGRAGSQHRGPKHAHLLQLGRRAQAQGSKDPGQLGHSQAEVRPFGSCGPGGDASECRHADCTTHSLANQTPRSVGNRLRAGHVRARDAVDRDHADGDDRHSRSGKDAGKRDARPDLRSRPRRRCGRRGLPAGSLRPRPPAARSAAARRPVRARPRRARLTGPPTTRPSGRQFRAPPSPWMRSRSSGGFSMICEKRTTVTVSSIATLRP